MTDTETTISTLRSRVEDFVRERDWAQFHTPKDLAAAISIEAAELQELFLWQTPVEVTEGLQRESLQDKVREELADIITYCLSLSNRLDMDVSDAVLAKLTVNMAKYPVDKARGNHKKYTEF